MSKIAIFPGTFDPITYGHQDLITRAANMFDTLIVAVAENQNKTPLFSLSQRVAMLEDTIGVNSNIIIKGFSNLLVEFVREHNAIAIVRGVRVVTDFEYELQLASMNRCLAPDIETIFLTPAEKHSYISSSLVKEAAQLGADISGFVDSRVAAALQAAIKSTAVDN